MDRKQFWNEAAKYGTLLGVVMAGSKILEQSMACSGNLSYISFIAIEWLVFAVLFCAILYRATKSRAAKNDPALGFSFFQGVNYMMLISIFAAVPVACAYYVYINSIIGYDNYIEGLISVLIQSAELQPMDAASADLIETLIDQMRSMPQGSIFSTLLNSVVQYTFAGLFAGLILAGFTRRQPVIFDKKDEL